MARKMPCTASSSGMASPETPTLALCAASYLTPATCTPMAHLLQPCFAPSTPQQVGTAYALPISLPHCTPPVTMLEISLVSWAETSPPSPYDREGKWLYSWWILITAPSNSLGDGVVENVTCNGVLTNSWIDIHNGWYRKLHPHTRDNHDHLHMLILGASGRLHIRYLRGKNK